MIGKFNSLRGKHERLSMECAICGEHKTRDFTIAGAACKFALYDEDTHEVNSYDLGGHLCQDCTDKWREICLAFWGQAEDELPRADSKGIVDELLEFIEKCGLSDEGVTEFISLSMAGIEAKDKARKLIKKYEDDAKSMQNQDDINTQTQVKINERLEFAEAIRDEFGIEEVMK